MATATNGALAKFKPSFTPESIALADKGTPTTSKYDGDQVRYRLTDGRFWYADLVSARTIDDMGITTGEVFQVAKSEKWDGNRRIVGTAINATITPAENSWQKLPAGIGATSNTNTNNNHHTAAQPAGGPPPVPAAAAAPAIAIAKPAPMNGAGETGAAQLARCYRDAVDIALSTVAYAKERGLLLTPGFEDIRCMSATLAIAENGGRR